MTFYLQDVSKPEAARTAATVTVGVSRRRLWSREELAADFHRLGVAAGDTVMLHASVRAIGECAGGPDDIHVALRQAVGPTGTIVMYTSAPWAYGLIGRGLLAREAEDELLRKLPPYDPLTTRSARQNGILVEMFRTWPGVDVSRGFARFAASGPLASAILAGQPWDCPFGKDSPLEHFLARDGKVVIAGADHAHVTLLHYLEHVADFPGKTLVRTTVPVEIDGQRTSREWERLADPAHPNWPERFFARIVDGFLAGTGNTGARVGEAQSYVFAARDLLAYAEPVMKAMAAKRSI
jgi:aminoglycoside 3-N-acetyltransferase